MSSSASNALTIITTTLANHVWLLWIVAHKLNHCNFPHQRILEPRTPPVHVPRLRLPLALWLSRLRISSSGSAVVVDSMDGDENIGRTFSSAIPRLAGAAQPASLRDITDASNNTTTTSGRMPRVRKEIESSSASTHPRQPVVANPPVPAPHPKRQQAPAPLSSRNQSSASHRTTSAGSASTVQSSAGSANNLSGGARRGPVHRAPSSIGHGRPRAAAERDKAAAQKAWDMDKRFDEMNTFFDRFADTVAGTSKQSEVMMGAMETYKKRIQELESKQAHLIDQMIELRVENETSNARLAAAEATARQQARDHESSLDEAQRRHGDELHRIQEERRQALECDQASHADGLREQQRQHELELQQERIKGECQLRELQAQTDLAAQRRKLEAGEAGREMARLRADIERLQAELDAERTRNSKLATALGAAAAASAAHESTIHDLRERIAFLESGSKEQSDAFSRLEAQRREAVEAAAIADERLMREETVRRRLHNAVMELKGNIRVFCRVRPLLAGDGGGGVEGAGEGARIAFPDLEGREIVVTGAEERNSLGAVTTRKHAFAFDRVFAPATDNAGVFSEISGLVQSAVDGYNVCIFCYGQTGSGKTHTMAAPDGLIRRAVGQIYDSTAPGGMLAAQGWRFAIEGSFVEVYNETIHDLLGDPDEADASGKRYEIRHDNRGRTTVTDAVVVPLDSPARVEALLRQAATNRSVAATRSNERSSRSHSVFMLRLAGVNERTGDRSAGTLNLVDLAGSERLAASGSAADKDRLRETQSINRSLSCLGDVIAALGQQQGSGSSSGSGALASGPAGQGLGAGPVAHIPYRNSKLTYLLQNSLGGNSKTLMLVMVSPLQGHLGETLTSLKFATKVHCTHVGTARRQR